MATVNFSVPDEVKARFNRIFAGQNKSAIIADLMRRAVEEVERQERRVTAIRQLTEARTGRKPATDEKLRAAREEGRQ